MRTASMLIKLVLFISIGVAQSNHTNLVAQDSTQGPFFASGIKIGEVTTDSAIVWIRLTKKVSADFSRLESLTKHVGGKQNNEIRMPTDLVEGASGVVRVIYWIDGEISAKKTDWTAVDNHADFTRQILLEDLIPNSSYKIRVESRRSAGEGKVNFIDGQFRTAPEFDRSTPIRFVVSTCQAVRSIDDGPQGHVAYQQIQNAEPHFFVHTGDIVYYDKLPLCKNEAEARAKWNLMFSFGHNRNFHKNVASYFMKDDHDTLKNDCWPGQTYGDLTFEQGLSIFREQTAMGERTYRTFRWGKDVQIWLTENRDFRSSNRDADGPTKTILGDAQKTWLKKSISGSDATFKFLISPGPIVGPDKKGKADNHANAAFQTEGQELRDFIASQDNLFVICGDRHWQYCSQDPKSGVFEMGCGPINDQHNFGGNPGRVPEYHRYFSAKGGFLMISVDGKSANAKWFGSSEVDSAGAPRLLHSETLESK